jgi:ParB-like chromosome segregation protein Spo0J
MTGPVAGVHPAAEIFPLLAGKEAADLAADIKANGLKEPIVLTADRLLLDGRNRLAACNATGTEPRFETWDGVGSPVDYVVSKNLRRRHLDVGQRAMIAVDLIPLYEEEARERQRDAAAATNEALGRTVSLKRGEASTEPGKSAFAHGRQRPETRTLETSPPD